MTQHKRYFVTGIDTDAGKTVVAAVITQKLKADYWKPVQAGKPTDSDTIRSLISKKLKVHQEGIMLDLPMSPHAAAKAQNLTIKKLDLVPPECDNHLVIEGAGGLMVPINDKDLIIELAEEFDSEIILVSRNYLGSINHTLLSIAYLKSQNLKIAGIIFNDETNHETESFILQYSGLQCLGRIPKLEDITPEIINELGKEIQLP